MLKLTDNPPLRLGSVKSVGEQAGDWWVAHAKARNEKAFAWEMHNRGFGYFLPMFEKITFSGSRTRHGMVLLFPSYVFFCGDLNHRQTALATNRLSTVLPVTNRDEFVRQIVNVEKAVEAKASLSLHPFVAAGKRWRVNVGPEEGVEGILIQDDRMTRLVLPVTAIGLACSLDIGPDQVSPVE